MNCLVLMPIFWIQIYGEKKTFTYDLRLAPTLFEEFQKSYNKSYTEQEKKLRFKIFKDNIKRVNALNQNVIQNWVAVIGPYNDLTYSEFIDKYDLPEYDDDSKGNRTVLACSNRKTYFFKRFSQYTKSNYEKWGSWKPPIEYESEEGLEDYDHDYD